MDDLPGAKPKSYSLLSSDEEKDDCLPKIVNTVSLQNCNTINFQDHEGVLPDNNNEVTTDFSGTENDSYSRSVHKKEKKRVELKSLGNVGKLKPSTSKKISSSNVVDAKKLALQESLFKTKELFDTFLRVCQDQESKPTDDMEKVVQKINRAYENAREEFLGSVRFQNLLEGETDKVNTSNTKPWLNMRAVLEELKHNRKYAHSRLKLGESEESQDNNTGSGDEQPIIECPKKRKHLKKLEKTLRALNLKIKSLEEREVDWDDEDNSAYIKLDRYRVQFNKVWKKVCEIKGKLPDADRSYLRKVAFAGTTYPHINRCIERYYNKHREFPDFQDIKKLVDIANEKENIVLQPIQVHEMAEKAFKEFGEMLKRLRQYDDYEIMISYLNQQQVDPATDDKALREELNKNALLFKKKEQEVIDRFAEQGASAVISESESSSESKHKKKRRRFLNTSLKNSIKPKTTKSTSSSSESSDEEKENIKNSKPKRPGVGLSSSDSDNASISGDNKTTKKPSSEPKIEGKGKALIGKKRLIKKGVKHFNSKINHTLSSNDESDKKDPKGTLTGYLGLHERVETVKKVESDIEEITCVQEIIKSQKSNVTLNNNVTPSPLSPNSNESCSSNKKKSNILNKNCDNNVVNCVSDSDSEPTHDLGSAVPNGKPHKKRKWSSSSESSSDEESEKKDITSGVELSSTKDPSSDISESEEDKKNANSNARVHDDGDGVIVLSEEVVLPGNSKSKAKNDSDGSDDDIFVLSQEDSNEEKDAASKKNSTGMCKDKPRFKRIVSPVKVHEQQRHNNISVPTSTKKHLPLTQKNAVAKKKTSGNINLKRHNHHQKRIVIPPKKPLILSSAEETVSNERSSNKTKHNCLVIELD